MSRFALTIALLAICGAALIDADKDAMIAKLMETAEVCKGEVGAAQSDVDEMVKKQPATTTEGNCLRACVMKKMGVMDANGKLDLAAAKEKAKQYTGNDPAKMKIADEMGAVCGGISVSDDHCVAAGQYGDCFHGEAVKHGVHND